MGSDAHLHVQLQELYALDGALLQELKCASDTHLTCSVDRSIAGTASAIFAVLEDQHLHCAVLRCYVNMSLMSSLQRRQKC